MSRKDRLPYKPGGVVFDLDDDVTIDVPRADLAVRVTDLQGKAVAGAEVTVEGPAPDCGIADADGSVGFASLTAGKYRVTATNPDFETRTLDVDVGGVARSTVKAFSGTEGTEKGPAAPGSPVPVQLARLDVIEFKATFDGNPAEWVGAPGRSKTIAVAEKRKTRLHFPKGKDRARDFELKLSWSVTGAETAIVKLTVDGDPKHAAGVKGSDVTKLTRDGGGTVTDFRLKFPPPDKPGKEPVTDLWLDLEIFENAKAKDPANSRNIVASVQPDPVAITNFHAILPRVNEGQHVSLMWTVTGDVDEAKIRQKPGPGGAAETIDDVVGLTDGTRGAMVLKDYKVEYGAADPKKVEFTLTVKDKGGTQQRTVAVVPPAGAPLPRVRSGEIKVDGKPFREWFNGDFRKFKPLDAETVPTRLFGAVISAVGKRREPGDPPADAPPGFPLVFDRLKELTGRDELSFNEFVAFFCIIYNESGGTFQSLGERGGGHPITNDSFLADQYFFQGGGKASYNGPDKGTHGDRRAGTQLKARRDAGKLDADVAKALADDKVCEVWNSQSAYPMSPPKGAGIDDATWTKVKLAARQCDFFKYRGHGLNQLTYRFNYDVVNEFLDKWPGLGTRAKEVDLLTLDELEEAMQVPDVYLNAHRRYYEVRGLGRVLGPVNDDPPHFLPTGNAVAGVGHPILPTFLRRCGLLLEALLSGVRVETAAAPALEVFLMFAEPPGRVVADGDEARFTWFVRGEFTRVELRQAHAAGGGAPVVTDVTDDTRKGGGFGQRAVTIKYSGNPAGETFTVVATGASGTAQAVATVKPPPPTT